MNLTYKRQVALITTLFLLTLTTLLIAAYFREFVELSCLQRATSQDYSSPLKYCLRTLYGGDYQNPILLNLSIILTLPPLFFLKEAVYKVWLIFALIVFPLGTLYVFSVPANPPSGFLPSIDREAVTIFVAGAFVVLSYLVIAITAWRHRGERDDTSPQT